jgi:hypothetical protein
MAGGSFSAACAFSPCPFAKEIREVIREAIDPIHRESP